MNEGEEVPLQGGRTAVWRKGDIILRETGPWAPSVHRLLGHLEKGGFEASPRVVGTGFDELGRETLSFIEGDFIHPLQWSDEGLVVLGKLLRRLHDATASFQASGDDIWQDWFGRNLSGWGGGDGPKIFGHCDLGPWNIVSQNGIPTGIIDWEVAGPIDPLVELAQACWLNVQLHDDKVAKLQGLPGAETRAKQLRLMVDAYGLDREARERLVQTMIDYAIHDAAEQVSGASVTPGSRDVTPLWGVTWRTRAAAWMTTHRTLLTEALF
jgi:hypothetical protein